MKGRFAFFVRPDQIRVHNPEPSAIDDQYYYLDRFRVIAEDEIGDRVVHVHLFEKEDEAERFADKVAVAHRKGRALSDDHWYPIDPCYGSKAYQRDEPFIAARERREEQQGW